MALQTRELFSSTTKSAFPRIAPTTVQVRKLGPDGAGATITVGTPLVYDATADDWNAWTDSDTVIDGFLYPDDVTLHATNEVLAQVMLAGELHVGDVVLPAGQTQGTLDEVLLAGVRPTIFVTEQSGAK